MITNSVSNSTLNALCGKTQSASYGAQCYLALSSTLPTKTGTNVTEPKKNGYARVLLGNYSQAYTQMMGTAVDGAITNEKEIHFNEVTAVNDNTGWGTLSYACLYSAASSGNLLAWGELGTYVEEVWTPQSISPVTNNVVVIKAGDLNIPME